MRLPRTIAKRCHPFRPRSPLTADDPALAGLWARPVAGAVLIVARVGQNMRAIRDAQGLSQEAFADLLGVHRTYMGGLERGERNLTLKTVERLAERLGIDVETLICQKPRASRSSSAARPRPNAGR